MPISTNKSRIDVYSCVGPITRPRSPTKCVIDSQAKTPRHRKVKEDG